MHDEDNIKKIGSSSKNFMNDDVHDDKGCRDGYVSNSKSLVQGGNSYTHVPSASVDGDGDDDDDDDYDFAPAA
ncbi:hypothetical protein QQP08_025956 [Theobroma cacao]|nr:hypothetical protein QQP08_025956 [Theobroma cacao]